MTLFDRYDKFVNTYIRRTPIDIPKPIEEDEIFEKKDYESESKKYSLDSLTPQLRREMALTAPFFWKGLTKKNRDTFKAWLRLERIKDKADPPAPEQMLIDIFNRRTQFKLKLKIVGICVGVYGDGFLLMQFDTDRISTEDYLSKSIPKGAEPRKLKILDPECLYEKKYKSDYWRKKKVQHYLYRNKTTGKEVYIHPDRILHFVEDELPFSQFGISKVDILRNIISSIADVDIATGEILKWFAHGLIQVTKEGLDINEKRHIEKELDKHHGFFVNDEKYTMDVKNPTAIKPKEFYDYLIQSIAAVLVMPSHLLQGTEIGKVTGAEVSYADYYNDIKDNQEFTYTNNIIKLYSLLFIANNRVFDYDLIWNDIYVNETAEADLLSKRSVAAVSLKGSNIIDTKEAREIMNRGQIKLDIDKVIKQDKPVAVLPKEPSEGSQPKVPKGDQGKGTLARLKSKLNKAKAKVKPKQEQYDGASGAIKMRRAIFELSQGELEVALQDLRLKQAKQGDGDKDARKL